MKAGIDEAGRGPVIGPMVMAILAIEEKDRQVLNKMGVKDSKLLTKAKRTKLARLLKQSFPHVIISVPPSTIDKAVMNPDDSLNLLEARTFSKLIARLQKKADIKEVMLDLPAKNKEVYLEAVTKTLKNIAVHAEFKADLHYPEVAAASILAKTTRDAAMRKEEKSIGIPLGSGYPADPVTKIALKEHFTILKDLPLLRKSWKTVQNLSQTQLNQW